MELGALWFVLARSNIAPISEDPIRSMQMGAQTTQSMFLMVKRSLIKLISQSSSLLPQKHGLRGFYS